MTGRKEFPSLFFSTASSSSSRSSSYSSRYRRSTFLQVDNVFNIFSAMDPLAITASGLALVVMSGRLDISVGSTAFLACATGALLMNATGLHPALAALVVVCCGALLGAVNGFIVIVLGVNSLIATLEHDDRLSGDRASL